MPVLHAGHDAHDPPPPAAPAAFDLTRSVTACRLRGWAFLVTSSLSPTRHMRWGGRGADGPTVGTATWLADAAFPPGPPPDDDARDSRIASSISG